MKKTHWDLTIHFTTTDEPIGIIHASQIREKIKKIMLDYKVKKICFDSFIKPMNSQE